MQSRCPAHRRGRGSGAQSTRALPKLGPETSEGGPRPRGLAPCPLGPCYAKQASPSPASSQRRTFCRWMASWHPSPLQILLPLHSKCPPFTLFSPLNRLVSQVLPCAAQQPLTAQRPLRRPRSPVRTVGPSARRVGGKKSIPHPVVLTSLRCLSCILPRGLLAPCTASRAAFLSGTQAALVPYLEAPAPLCPSFILQGMCCDDSW